jgi:hypothetical protein
MADITLYRKTDQTIDFQYYDTDNTTARTLAGATVYFTVKTNKYDSDSDDSEALIYKNVTSHTNAAAGESQIVLSDTETNVEPNRYFYDIKVKESDGNIYLATSGTCKIIATTTNRSN